MNADRALRIAAGLAIGAHALFLLLTIWEPSWTWTALDRKHNLPQDLQALLLAAVAILAIDLFRLETRLLRQTGQARLWAFAWLGIAALFAYIAIDEAVLIHQRVNTDIYQAGLGPTSSLQAMVVWLLIYLPGIVGAILWLVVSLSARRRLSASLVAWGGVGLAVWLSCLILEGTAKTVFIPRDIFRVEVLTKETLETVAVLAWGWALWRYRSDLQRWLAAPAAVTPRVAIPWRAAIASSLVALCVPAAVIAGGIALNPQALQKARGDQYFRAGRYDEAARAYQATVALAPGWARVWDRLGVVEFRRGDLEAAAHAFAQAERLSAHDPTPSSHRAAVWFRQGRYTEAAQAFTLATKIDPTDAEAHRNLGITLERLGRSEDAEIAFRQAELLGLSRDSATVVRVSVTPDLHLAYLAHPALAVGLALSRAGRLDLAISEYRRVVELMPALAAAHLALANELLSAEVAGRVARRLTADQAPEEDMDSALPVVAFLHSVRQLDGRWEVLDATVQSAALEAPLGRDVLRRARDQYRDALKLGAGAPAHLGLGLLAREAGDLAEARRQLKAARALDPAMPPLTELTPVRFDLSAARH